ncbi:MAG: replicative DNA helicase [Actinomycetia bacterium]|nr:replicative DNA helicase [Actinomycetes bacterium]
MQDKIKKDSRFMPLDTSRLQRIPPYNIEAEESLLGSMLISRDAVATIIEIVETGDFYRSSNQMIFEVILEMYSRGEPSDPITVADHLKKKGMLDEVGGKTFIHSLISNIPLAANAEYYARIVRNHSILRKLIYAATDIATMGYEVPEDLTTTVDKAQELIFSIYQDLNSKNSRNAVLPMKDIVSEVYDQIEALHESGSDISGIPTGFIDFDKYSSGLHNSDMVVIAARPGMGKTAFVLGMAKNIAMKEKIPIAVFSLEMSKQQVAQRLMSAQSGIDLQRLRDGKLREDEWAKLARAIEKLAECKLYVDDSAFLTVMDLRSRARMMASTHGIKMIIVDYLQLMQSTSNYKGNKVQEITEISQNLKGIAKELDIPVIAVSQLSREVERREKKRPQLSDLRESGSIEQDADMVVFIYRDEYYDDQSSKKGRAELIIAKHRNGPTGKVELQFNKRYALFSNLTQSKQTENRGDGNV